MSKIITLTQNKQTIIDDDDYERVIRYNWCYGSKGYAICNLPRINGKRNTLRLHRFIMSCPENLYVDHINGDTLDNRKENLRICTQQQNNFNRNVINKFKGVSWHKLNNKYISHIKVNGKLIHLGYFTDIQEAAKVYDKAAIEHFGEFANLNFKVK